VGGWVGKWAGGRAGGRTDGRMDILFPPILESIAYFYTYTCV